MEWPTRNGKPKNGNGPKPPKPPVERVVPLPEPNNHPPEFYGGHADYERPGYNEPSHDEIDHHETRRLDALAEAIKKLPLDNIAEMTLALTFGDMMLFAEGIWKSANVEQITRENLPMVLHNWAAAKVHGDKNE